MAENGRIRTGSGRRQFLQTTFSGAVVAIAVQAGVDFASPATVSAQTDLSPDAALQELLAGNQRFATNQLTSIEHDLIILWNSFLIRPLGTSSSRESPAIL
jgi:hypothetical protein